MLKKTLIYLGLGPDEEYDAFDDYAPNDAMPAEQAPATARPVQQAAPRPVRAVADPAPVPQSATVRPIAAVSRPEPSSKCRSSRTLPVSSPCSSGEYTSTDMESLQIILDMLLDAHADGMENDASLVPLDLLIYCTQDIHEQYAELWDRLRMKAENVEVMLLENGALGFIAARVADQGGVNLLQGDYAPKSELNIEWGPWKLPAALLAACVLLVLILQGVSYWQLTREEAVLDEGARTVLLQTFPDADPDKDPWNELTSRLGGVPTDAPVSSVGFSEAIEILAKAFAATDNLQMQTISYREGILDLQLLAPDVNSLDTLRQKIGESGSFNAAIQSANPDDEVIKGRMQITAVAE